MHGPTNNVIILNRAVRCSKRVAAILGPKADPDAFCMLDVVAVCTYLRTIRLVYETDSGNYGDIKRELLRLVIRSNPVIL